MKMEYLDDQEFRSLLFGFKKELKEINFQSKKESAKRIVECNSDCVHSDAGECRFHHIVITGMGKCISYEQKKEK